MQAQAAEFSGYAGQFRCFLENASFAMCKSMCDLVHMATNVQIDPDLIRDALLLGGKRTKREVIEEALQEYVLRRKQQQVLSLFGTVDYDPGYDYKKQRARR
jgi:hypothetical protein